MREELDALIDRGDSLAALGRLADGLAAGEQYDRLFEVRKLQSRLRLGVPPVYGQRPPSLAPEVERQLEHDLAAAALECGTLLAKSGQAASAWRYLQVVEDRAAVRAALEQSPRTADNSPALIEICLHQLAHPGLGMSIAVRHLGTCSSITLLDSAMHLMDGDSLDAALSVLVDHLSAELADVACRRLGLDAGLTLASLMADHQEALARTAPHGDPSHVYGVLRLGRTVRDQSTLQRLLVLARYAGLLPEGVRYPGEPPFPDQALHHELWLAALAGGPADLAVDHFCRNLDRYEQPPARLVALEYGVLLLARLGRGTEAADLACNHGLDLPELDYGAAGIGPHLIELALAPDASPVIAEYYAQRRDWLGYSMARLASHQHVRKHAGQT